MWMRKLKWIAYFIFQLQFYSQFDEDWVKFKELWLQRTNSLNNLLHHEINKLCKHRNKKNCLLQHLTNIYDDL